MLSILRRWKGWRFGREWCNHPARRTAWHAKNNITRRMAGGQWKSTAWQGSLPGGSEVRHFLRQRHRSRCICDEIGSCGVETWSACGYTCTQTKIESVLMNDGKCHEEKSLETTRPCHVQACGRSDPCRVRFVVHTIMEEVRGAVASRWNKHGKCCSWWGSSF